MMIGSMSPDFAYFLPHGLTEISSHEADGILLFCWPVSFALWLLFVHLLEHPTIELLPAAWRARVPRSDRVISIKALAFASLAVVLGAMTHVAWDAFTHGNTPVTAAFPALRAELFTFHGRSIRVYLVLQYLCSIIGLLSLGYWAFNIRRSAPCAHGTNETRSMLTDGTRIGAALTIAAASAATAVLSYLSYSGSRFEHRIFQFLIGGMTGWALAWAAVALLIG